MKDLKITIHFFLRTCLIFVVVFFMLTACSFKKEILPPPNLIGEDTMEFILVDFTLSEVALNGMGIPNDTVKKTDVLATYKISLQRFDTSFTYYARHPQKLKDIYTNVLEDLNQK